MPLRVPECLSVVLLPGEHPAVVCTVEPRFEYEEPPTPGEIKELIEAQGARGWFVDDGAIRRMLVEWRFLEVTSSYRVAERRDCQIKVEVGPDELRAYIEVLPAHGGQLATIERIQAELEKAGVRFGIDQEQLREVVSAGYCERTLIAKGISPQPGSDAEFERLVQESATPGRPQERADGSVDYHNLGLFMSVSPGTPLLRRLPPTPGVPGRTVRGTEIPAKPGRDRKCIPGTGTRLSDADPDVIVATKVGQPVYLGSGVRIAEVLELDGVGVETGDVAFEGSVFIRGTIQPGFKVKAGGNILVSETVEGADLTAGGHIEIRGGIFGKRGCTISAKGHIKARFLNNCIIHCEGDLIVHDQVANCEITCEGAIHLGHGGGKGQVYGGKSLATKGIYANILGSVAETHTQVELQPAPRLLSRHQEVIQEISRLRQNLDNVERSLQFLERQSSGADPRIPKFAEAARVLQGQLAGLKAESEEIEEKIHAPVEGAIVSRLAYPGVSYRAGRQRQAVSSIIREFHVAHEPEEQHTEDPQPARHPVDRTPFSGPATPKVDKGISLARFRESVNPRAATRPARRGPVHRSRGGKG